MDIQIALWDNAIRTDRVIWLDGQTARPSQELCSFFEEMDMKAVETKALWQSLTGGEFPWRRFAKDLRERGAAVAIEILLHDLLGGGPLHPIGFLVRVATPFPLTFDQHGRRETYAWGRYMFHWMHTPRLDAEFVRAAIAWRDARVADLYTESMKKNTKEQACPNTK